MGFGSLVGFEGPYAGVGWGLFRRRAGDVRACMFLRVRFGSLIGLEGRCAGVGWGLFLPRAGAVQACLFLRRAGALRAR